MIEHLNYEEMCREEQYAGEVYGNRTKYEILTDKLNECITVLNNLEEKEK